MQRGLEATEMTPAVVAEEGVTASVIRAIPPLAGADMVAHIAGCAAQRSTDCEAEQAGRKIATEAAFVPMSPIEASDIGCRPIGCGSSANRCTARHRDSGRSSCRCSCPAAGSSDSRVPLKPA